MHGWLPVRQLVTSGKRLTKADGERSKVRKLIQLSRARTALEKASTLPEIKDIRDKAEAIRMYAKASGETLAMQNKCAEIRLRAERKAGRLLKRMERHKASDGRPKKVSQAVTLTDLNIHRMQSQRWQKIASLSDKEFEKAVTEIPDLEELTQYSLLKLVGEKQRQETKESRQQQQLPKGTFNLVYADPPWQYEHSRTNSRKIENQYPVLTLDEICKLADSAGRSVKTIFAQNCVLFLWTTSPKLRESFEVMESWGFTYRTCMVWDKEKIGMGYYARQQHELLLIATRGTPSVPEPENRPPSIIRSPRLDHSEKPGVFHTLLEEMYPHAARVELFCRSPQRGWVSWGNE